MRRKLISLSVFIVITVGCSASATHTFIDPRNARSMVQDASDPACEEATLVSTGGSFPRDPSTLAIRWTGYSNFELVIKNALFSSTPISTVAVCFRRLALGPRM